MIRLNDHIAVLETAHYSYWMDLTGFVPLNLYWEPWVETKDAVQLSFAGNHSSFDADLAREHFEYPVWDGRTFGFTVLRAKKPIFPEITETIAEAECLFIMLKDTEHGVSARLCYRVYAEFDVTELHAEITACSKPSFSDRSPTA